MIRPDVRIVQAQHEEIRDAQIDSWEAEQLLRKYGHQTQRNESPPVQDQGLTFEEMVAREESRIASEKARRTTGQHRPSTFDGSGGYHSETRYGQDDESGYNFKIQITTDMQIPKY